MPTNIDETVEEWARAKSQQRMADPRFGRTVESVIGIGSFLFAGIIATAVTDPTWWQFLLLAVVAGGGSAWVSHTALEVVLRAYYQRRAPIAQRDEARAEIRNIRCQPTIEITEMGWPREVGNVLVIPVQVANADVVRAVDLDIDCWTQPFDGINTLLAVENDPVIGVEGVLSSAQRAEGHLVMPLRIPPNSRRVGYLAYSLDEVHVDTWSSIDLQITDGVRHTEIGSPKEVWPSLWPAILFGENGINTRRDFRTLE